MLYKIGGFALLAGLVLSFHDTLWPWAFWAVVVSAGAMALHFQLSRKED